MVMSCAAILNGWNTTCSTRESYSSSSSSYVSSYARTSRPEDRADTWAYLWHRTNQVIAGCSDPGLRAKVQYLSSILDKNYSSFDSSTPLGLCSALTASNSLDRDRCFIGSSCRLSLIYYDTIIIVCRRAPIVYLSIWDAHKQTYLRQRAIFLPGKRLNTRLRSYGPF